MCDVVCVMATARENHKILSVKWLCERVYTAHTHSFTHAHTAIHTVYTQLSTQSYTA